MLLHDSLEDAVRDVAADVPALLVASRREGAAIRRRRRAAATLGAAAAVAVLAAGGYILVPGSGPATTVRDPGLTSVPVTAPLSGATAPVTGRAAVAALVDAVDQVADGTFSELSGADPVVAPARVLDSSARVRFRPAAGGPATVLFLNLDKLSRDEVASDVTCEGVDARMDDCEVTRLLGGDVLRTYTDRFSSDSPGYERRVAEVRSPARGLRVILGSSNTSDGDTTVPGASPALTIDQLAAVVTRPWWDLRRLPVEYAEAGDRLAAYRDHGASS